MIAHSLKKRGNESIHRVASEDEPQPNLMGAAFNSPR